MKNAWIILFALCAAISPAQSAQDRKVDIERTDYDPILVWQQNKSLINWQEDPKDFLSLEKWITERQLKDEQPGWRIRQRISAHPEMMARVLSCIGKCKLFRGAKPHNIRFSSRIYEGDEVHTEKGSYLWASLVDGSLVRMAPDSTLSFLEINFEVKKVFHNLRLSQGYVHWLHRSEREQKLTTTTDTDPLFLPLLVKESNLTWFQRQLFQKADEKNQILLSTSNDYLGVKEHQQTLNELIKKNNEFLKDVESEVLFVAPNGSIHVKNTSFSWYYGVAEDSYFKLFSRNSEEEGEQSSARLHNFLFRGYVNNTEKNIDLDVWMRVDRDGRQCDPLEFNVPQLLSSEIPYRRPTTLLLAREIWLASQKTLWKDLASEEKLANNWGIRLWKEDLSSRLEFLKSYSRRIETTNLRSVQKLTDSLILSEQAVKAVFDEHYFTQSLEAYYRSIKTRHSFSQESVRDMSDLHYYGWLLKNARQY